MIEKNFRFSLLLIKEILKFFFFLPILLVITPLFIAREMGNVRIIGNSSIDAAQTSKINSISTVNNNVKTMQEIGTEESTKGFGEQPNKVSATEDSQDTKMKLQEAVNKMNEMLEVNENHSKFMYHEGLDRYYVTIVDRKTEEVVKEIPAKKLLDAFYEMQKMLGMVVDEKI